MVECVEALATQQLVSELTFEAFDVTVFSRRPRLNVDGSHADHFQPQIAGVLPSK